MPDVLTRRRFWDCVLGIAQVGLLAGVIAIMFYVVGEWPRLQPLHHLALESRTVCKVITPQGLEPVDRVWLERSGRNGYIALVPQPYPDGNGYRCPAPLHMPAANYLTPSGHLFTTDMAIYPGETLGSPHYATRFDAGYIEGRLWHNRFLGVVGYTLTWPTLFSWILAIPGYTVMVLSLRANCNFMGHEAMENHPRMKELSKLPLPFTGNHRCVI